MGFKWFRAKISKRFNTIPIEFLQPPKGWRDPVVQRGKIKCQALEDSTVYMSSQGIIHPCCWLGVDRQAKLDTFDSVKSTWNTSAPNQICQINCSGDTQGTSFTNQWQREVEFK